MKADAETARLAVLNLAEFICESDAIENIYDEPALVITQIEQRKKDGHVGALLLLESLVQSYVNAGGYATGELLCRIQGMITREQHLKPGGVQLNPKYVGSYRPEGVQISVGGQVMTSSVLVPPKMSSLLEKIGSWQDSCRFYPENYNLNFIADSHHHFETIHLFVDGNGRTGRALAYYMMRWAGLKPFIFTSRDKREKYYPCFQNSSDSSLTRDYFSEKYLQNLYQ